MDFELIQGRGADYGVLHIRAINAQSLAQMVSLAGKVSMALAVELVELGAVYVNEIRTMIALTGLVQGDRVRAHLAPRRFDCKSELLSRLGNAFAGMRSIESLDGRVQLPPYVIVDKPAGLPSHAQVDNAKENLISLLESEIKPQWGSKVKLLITHRLDIETSGLLILALNAEAQRRINQDLQAKMITRRYYAWVEEPVEPGNYRHFMEPSRGAPKTVTLAPQAGWLECSLSILSCEPGEGVLKECELAGPAPLLSVVESRRFWRLTVELQTGRSQQIRAQLAHIGSPILGDRAYGSKYFFTGSFASGAAIALRAFEVSGISLG